MLKLWGNIRVVKFADFLNEQFIIIQPYKYDFVAIDNKLIYIIETDEPRNYGIEIARLKGYASVRVGYVDEKFNLYPIKSDFYDEQKFIITFTEIFRSIAPMMDYVTFDFSEEQDKSHHLLFRCIFLHDLKNEYQLINDDLMNLYSYKIIVKYRNSLSSNFSLMSEITLS